MSMNKFAIAGGALAVMGLAWTPAHAGEFTEVDLLDGNSNTLAEDVSQLDWASNSSGGALTVGPFGTALSVGQTFDFVYQSQLVNAFVSIDNGGGSAYNDITTLDVSSGGDAIADGDHQFTIVASFQEEVLFFAGAGAIQSATFILGDAGGTISIFYDDSDLSGTTGDATLGTGFDDGIEVARFTLTDALSTFTANLGDGSGTGSASIDAELVAILDFVLEDYILGLEGLVFDMEFAALIEFPGTNSEAQSTTAFHASSPFGGGTDIYPTENVFENNTLLLQVDGLNSFTTKIPEPNALMLFGVGLALLGFAARRRRPAA